MQLNQNINIDGLSKIEAQKRLSKKGFNEIVLEKPKTILNFIINTIKEPIIILLLIGAGIYLLLGDPREAGILFVSVFVVMTITIYQEQKTEKSIQALRNIASPVAKVIRQGNELQIPAREVVVGDIILISEGDKIPADAKIIECSNLMVNESILTGESMMVTKINYNGDDVSNVRPGGDNLSIVFGSTLVTKGHAHAEVITTGLNSQVGKIGQELQTLDIEKTLLQKEVTKVVKIMAFVGLLFCFILIVVYGLTRHDWLNAILAGITLAMGTLPEELPIVMTLFLTMGAWRLSQKKVLARRAAAIETLGSVSVLCVDKTGTVTQNKMTISKIFYNGKYFENENLKQDSLNEIFKIGVLASSKNPFDPMEKAFINAGYKYLQSEDIFSNYTLDKEYTLEKQSLSVVYTYKEKNGNYLIAAKGSPESIIDLCHLKSSVLDDLKNRSDEMAKMGLRVIAVAKSIYHGEKLPENRHDFEFNFVGLVGLSDPVKEGVKEAVELCKSAGVKVMIITGDYPETAKSIARQIGLENLKEVITGEELENLSETELIENIKNVSIFSRVLPEQKLKIVNALKKTGEVVAMTGDGVNDAPALKAANVGIAMGLHGTDVAREAAALVLLDDHFASIIKGIKLGRRIFDNLQKAATYIFAVHIPIIGLSLLPVFFGWPLLLFPIHIVFLELIIDPVCTLVFESEKEDSEIMQRKPRKLNQRIFNRQIVLVGIVQGIVAFIVTLIAYEIAVNINLNENQLRTFVFSTLIISNLFLIVANRSWHHYLLKTLIRKNIAFFFVIIFTLLVLLFSIYIPALNTIFKFSPLSYQMLILAFLLGLVSILWFDIYKYYFIIRK